jgi:hypothetical protein
MSTTTAFASSVPSINLMETVNPTSCYSLPAKISTLTSSVLPITPKGAEAPITTYFDEDGIPAPLYSTKVNGIDVIYDMSKPGVKTIYTAQGTLIWDSTGIHMFTADCLHQYDVLNSEIDKVRNSALPSSSPSSSPSLAPRSAPRSAPGSVETRSNTLAKRAQVSYIPFLLEMFIGDSCYNGVEDLVEPLIALEKTRPATDPDCRFVMHESFAYGWQCAYYRGRALCEEKAKTSMDGICSDPSGIIGLCSVLDDSMTLLELAVTAGLLAVVAPPALAPVVVVLATSCAIISAVHDAACPSEPADREKKIKDVCAKYGDDPASLSVALLAPELQMAVGSVLPPPLHSTNMTLAAPITVTLQNRVPDFYVYPVPGNLLINGGFDAKGCGPVSSFTDATAPWVKDGKTLSVSEERFFWNRQNEPGTCSSNLKGDGCV